MKVLLVNPAVTDTNKGNNVTSTRWKHQLETLGHEVSIQNDYKPGDWDCLLALHAYKSSETIKGFSDRHPTARVLLALTGTDLYRDLDNPEARASLERSDDLIVLQPLALRRLPARYHDRTHVIYQSVLSIPQTGRRPEGHPGGLMALSVAHLRAVKDPLRLARALRELSEPSSIRGYHLGGVLDEDYREELQSFENVERFSYLGEVSRQRTLEYTKGADLLVISSRLEGGANVVSEAIACDTPVVASDIPGNRGLLGEDYPAYFPVEDTEALRNLLVKCENNQDFYRRLEECITSIKPRFSPDHERAQWEDLLQSW